MTAQCFVDTNILIYAARARNDEKSKFAVASEIIQHERFCVSAQVLQEFYVAVQKADPRKAEAVPLSEPKAAEWVGWLEPFCEVTTDSFLVLRAIETSRRHQISYWDAAIIAAAERASVPIVYSEDLNHGQHFGDVQVLNPFRPR
jgi:predicted nucleic acid-binding protein